MDFKSDEKDMTGDTESNQEATLPGAGDSGAGDPGMCVPRASQSGVNSEGITLQGPAAPGTRLPGTDGATVEDLIRQLEKEKCMKRRAERALVKQKRINLAPRKKQFNQQEVKTKKPYRLNSPPIIISIVEAAASVGLHVLNITLSRI